MRSYLILICIGLFAPLYSAAAQIVERLDTVLHVTDSVRVYFPVSKSEFIPEFEGNGGRIAEAVYHLRKVRHNKKVHLDHVSVESSSSPEGRVSFNEKLSLDRVMSIGNYLRDNYYASYDIMDLNYRLVDWDRFRYLLEQDPGVPDREKVLEIVGREDLEALRAMKGTRSWDYMLREIYPLLRTTFALFHYTVLLNQVDSSITRWEGMEEDILDALIAEVPDTLDNTIDAPEYAFLPLNLPKVEKLEPKVISTPPHPLQPERQQPSVSVSEEEPRRLAYHEWYVKTNALLYPLLIPNIGIEYRPLERFSFGGQAYYSAVNWFSPGTKFRVLGLQIEGRYWFRDHMQGPFAGIHATFGWYNVAWGGDYRYQDHKGKTPGYGTGLTLGWKVPILRRLTSGRMGLEFTVGAGVMPLHYDIFYNVENGRLAGEDRLTYWGPDNASINFVYRFGGNRAAEKAAAKAREKEWENFDWNYNK